MPKRTIFEACANGNQSVASTAAAPSSSNQEQCCLGGPLRNRASNKHVLTDAERELAQELNALSIKQREEVIEDLHGVSPVIEETEEIVERSLRELQQHLSKGESNNGIDRMRGFGNNSAVAVADIFVHDNIHTHKNPRKVYERALFLNPSRVKDRAFLLMFLRAELFDPEKAASKLYQYFAMKLELFGMEKLVTPITFDDLSDTDRLVLRMGTVQPFSDCKDQRRRALCFCFPFYQMKPDDFFLDSIYRVNWYLTMSAIQDDVETQRNGMVVVISTIQDHCNLNQTKIKTTKYAPVVPSHWLRGAWYSHGIPLRAVGFHFCYDNNLLRAPLAFMQRTLSSQWRLRIRDHFGSHLEIQYSLVQFGIPINVMPFGDDGRVDMSKLERQIQVLRDREQRSREQRKKLMAENNADGKDVTVVENPRMEDVLLGRGKSHNEFPGNQRLIELINIHKHKYQAAEDMDEKTVLSESVISFIRAENGRFLERYGDFGWIVTTDMKARKKIAGLFRKP